MANHGKNSKPWEKGKGFEMKGEGVLHRPKKVHHHVALEIAELHGPDRADELLRPLMPSARDRVMGKADGHHKHAGWHPQSGRTLGRVELNVRGGMIG